MPGPRAKQNGAKKHKQKATLTSQRQPQIEDKPTEPQGVLDTPSGSPSSTVFTSLAGLPFIRATPMRILNSLDELSSEQWNKVAQVLCNHIKIPDLTKRSGLKKVYQNFEEVYTRIDDLYTAHAGNELIRGGVVAIYAKMSADSILRNLLFHKSILAKILALVEKDNSRHLALRALTTVTHHGGADIRKEISLQAPTLIKVLQDFPQDLHGAELTISVLAHAAAASVDGPQRPAAKFVNTLNLRTLIPLVMDFVAKPGVELPLLHHALEFFGHLTHYCWKECFARPACIDFLVACTRSPDLHSRFYALGAVLRLHTTLAEPEPLLNSPGPLMQSAERGIPRHLDRLITDYGMMNCEVTLSVKCASDYQKAMAQCLRDRDIYTLGLTLAELIPCTDFSIGNGGFQDFNEKTGRVEFVSGGLPFTMWADSLPHCAKAIRERGKRGEEDIADMLDTKYCMIRHRVPDAVLFARRAINRNPNIPYFYYVMTFAPDVEEALRYAKKGFKLKNASTFVHYVLLGRAVEIAGNLAVCRMQESVFCDQRWDQGQALLNSALDDARIFLEEAPPDMRIRKSVLYWYIMLSLADRGPELSLDLREIKHLVDKLQICDDFAALFGIKPPKTQLRLAQELIFKRYKEASLKWGRVVARLDSTSIDHEHVVSRDKAEDRLAAWLHDIRHENGDDIDDHTPERSSHPKWSENPAVLHECSWCGNASAVLRKCAGCAKARYCDASCQKSAWPEHKSECKGRKSTSSTA